MSKVLKANANYYSQEELDKLLQDTLEVFNLYLYDRKRKN